ncbi:MAG: aminotransferase class I/II-fold pyridoxal phosphate-dependent enzyme [Bdellovibrionales bacterium]|nr:aminotransferase class I/II-fold pyridoxal phosphate-dependent enzyme [Bdellovibrionales bacterium]
MIGSAIHEILQTLQAAHLYRKLSLGTGVSFVDNDYLGLSTHTRLIEAGKRALDLYGAGSKGSRLLGGHSHLFESVEEAVARFFGAPAALLFSTGYLANLAAVGVLAEVCESVVSDEKNHASIIDAIRLSRLPKTIVSHLLWDPIAQQKGALFVSESLFSMDGDLAPVETIVRAAEASGGFALIDEAHAAGVFGEQGEGLLPRRHNWDAVAKVVTFGKAFGVGGAALCGSRRFIDLVLNRARPFIFTTAPPPVVVAMIGEALKVVRAEPWRRTELRDRAQWVRHLWEKLPGSPLPAPKTPLEWESPILPFRVCGADRVLRFCENVRESGLEIRAIRTPTVAEGEERLRVSLNLRVSRDNTETMAEMLRDLWTEFLLREQILE